MKASQMIEELQAMIAQYGDLEVTTSEDDEPGIEYNDDDENLGPVLVIGR